MIYNDGGLRGYKTYNPVNNMAKVLEKQVASANKWKMEKMEGDVDPNSFAAKLKQADEYAASGVDVTKITEGDSYALKVE